MRSKGRKGHFISMGADPRDNVGSGATINCHLRFWVLGSSLTGLAEPKGWILPAGPLDSFDRQGEYSVARPRLTPAEADGKTVLCIAST